MRKFVFTILILLSFCFVSCNFSSSKTDFADLLDNIDGFLQNKNLSSAKYFLNKAEKQACTALQYMSVVKRYMLLSMNNKLDALLPKIQKKFPLDKNIAFVYVNHLIKMGDYENAKKYCGILKNTVYESLYAEVLLHSSQDYKALSLAPLYKIAGDATKNNQFYVNAAYIYAKENDYPSAMALHPKKLTSYDNVLFWSLLSYDSGDFLRAIEDVQLGEFSVKGELLKADSFIKLKDYQSASVIWKNLLSEKNIQSEYIIMNIAKSAFIAKNINDTQKYLYLLVEKYPNYVDGLVFYGKFACFTNQNIIKDDILAEELRKYGYKSLKMEKDDNRIVIPITDALYRMDNALKVLYDLGFNTNPKNGRVKALSKECLDRTYSKNDADKQDLYYKLLVERQKLQWLYDNQYDKNQKLIDIWKLLEHCSSDNKNYPQYLVHYACYYFTFIERYEEAYNLLLNYLKNEYNIENSKEVVLNYLDFSAYEKELLAFLHVKLYNDYATYQNILESIDYDKKSIEVLLNLANIYESQFMYQNALENYSLAEKSTTDNKIKSQIHYNIANVLIKQNNLEDGILSLNYSVSLDPGNTKSRLLLKKLLNNGN